MSVKQITKGEKGWWKILNDGLQEASNDMFHLESDWTNSGMTGMNGFHVVDGKYKIISSKQTGFHIALIMCTLGTPGLAASQKTDCLALPFYVNNGAVIDTYPVQGGDELVRMQLSSSSGNTVISIDNASSVNTDPANIQVAMGIVWSL